MRLILAMIQVICLMAAQSTDYGNQSRLIRRLLQIGGILRYECYSTMIRLLPFQLNSNRYCKSQKTYVPSVS